MRTAKTDQTGWMHRLIEVFAGHTVHFDSFVVLWLILYVLLCLGSYNSVDTNFQDHASSLRPYRVKIGGRGGGG